MSNVQFYVSVAVMPAVTILAVLLGIFWNNARFTDLNNTLNVRWSDLRSEMNARINESNARINDLRDGLRAEMAKNHSELLAKLSEMDTRMTKFESQAK